MRRPANLWEQHQGKARAEAARGMGLWPVQSHPCRLEPPWDPFDAQSLSLWEAAFNDWDAPWEGAWWKRLFPPAPLLSEGERLALPEVAQCETDQLAHIVIEQFPEDESTIAKADVFLRSLANLTAPVSFEILGMGAMPMYDHEKAGELIAAGESKRLKETICGWYEPYIKTQFVAQPGDAKQVQHQLLSQYSNSAVLVGHEECDTEDWDIVGGINNDGIVGTLCLRHGYFETLRLFTKLDPDPLGVVLSAMDHLGKKDWALLQILFQPATQPWSETLLESMQNPYKGKFWFTDISPRQLEDKFSNPLFAVTIRIAARTPEIFRHLQGWAEQFSSPPQGFDCIFDSDDEDANPGAAMMYRNTYRSGILLNVAELASLVHLPGESVVSERLRRVKTRTRPAPNCRNGSSAVVLGENVHRGITQPALIPAELRPRHCYLAGASGTGKSTLLLNMILQDIEAGHGVGVLDPHGDLIHDVLRRIPEHRISDVILFDPADDQFPFALNILEARDEAERERIVAETIMSLERYFPSAWGPRLERILTFTLYTVLDAIPGATLADVERMLIDPKFREDVVLKTKNPNYVDFWNKQFVFLPKNACDSVLNKLSVFLLNRTVRNIICQRRSAIDFDGVLNDGKILLANLSTGLLTEKIAGTLGSFIVTKIVNAAFRRSRFPEAERRPWYLYVDEFQNFMNLSIGFERILAEARKYNLVLAGLANQYVGQISAPVRQSIFGNVGTLVVFRVGIDDSLLVSRELGVFTSDEILNLGVGQAFVRSGTSAGAFNLRTYSKPDPTDADPTCRIQALTRTCYATPLGEVETELAPVAAVERPPRDKENRAEPEDPSEDDLVV